MNESGQAVQSLLTIFEAQPESLILIIDELDIEVGKIRIRPDGGDAGQRGMRSIKGVLGSLDFPRVRIGVGRPYVGDAPSRDPDVVAEHLLSDPPRDEAAILRAAERRAAEAVVVILRDGIEAAMNTYNG
jgi:PTH1 family peptidyl-tRNA hydrolase